GRRAPRRLRQHVLLPPARRPPRRLPEPGAAGRRGRLPQPHHRLPGRVPVATSLHPPRRREPRRAPRPPPPRAPLPRRGRPRPPRVGARPRLRPRRRARAHRRRAHRGAAGEVGRAPLSARAVVPDAAPRPTGPPAVAGARARGGRGRTRTRTRTRIRSIRIRTTSTHTSLASPAHHPGLAARRHRP